MTYTQMRRYVNQENAKYPPQLVRVEPADWPAVEAPEGLEQVWRSNKFIVQVYAPKHGARRLTINRTTLPPLQPMGRDRLYEDGISWDDLQRLKREAGFGDCHAVELFPADASVVNVANMRHLWVLDAPLPFTWRLGEGK